MRDVEEQLRTGLRRLVATAPATAPPDAYERVVRRHRRRVTAARYGVGAGVVAVLAAAVAIPGALSPKPDASQLLTSTTVSTVKRGYLEPIVWVPRPGTLVGCHGPEPGRAQHCQESSSFTVTPPSGPPGTRVTIAGEGCARSRGGRQVSVALERESGGGKYWDGMPVRPDGSFRFSMTVPRTIVPHRYEIRLDCSGPGVGVEGYRPFTVVKAKRGPGLGRPDGGGFSAVAERGPDGKLVVGLSGTGCFLPQSGGTPGGIVAFVVSKPDAPFTGYTPDFGTGFGLFWVGSDGTWSVPRAIEIPGRGTRDLHAFCLDGMWQPGFKYARVYRLEGGRLTDVTR